MRQFLLNDLAEKTRTRRKTKKTLRTLFQQIKISMIRKKPGTERPRPKQILFHLCDAFSLDYRGSDGS